MTSTNTNPTDFSVADVLAWARTKPADERYDFLDPGNCAVAQFGRETGREYLINIGDIGRYSVPLRLAVINEGRDAGRTFGALAKRLEALVPKSAWTRSDAYLNDLELVRV